MTQMMEAEAAANQTNLLQELNRRCEAFEEQARCDAAERLALRRQLAAHEKLAQRRAADEEADRFEQRGAAVLLQQREEQLRSTREELRLERDLAFALREQVAAIEAVRATDARELRELQGRRSHVASPGGGTLPGGPPHTPTRAPEATAGDEATWESILGERVQALEEARAGAQAEAATLRQQLEAARQQGETALAQGPAEQARQEAAAVQAQLQAQLEQARQIEPTPETICTLYMHGVCVHDVCIGALARWRIGPLVHWSTGPLAHWRIIALVHWCIGALVHWQAREVAEARRGEAAAASAAAESLRQRQGEQEYWLGRRTALLESAHREVGSLQLQLAAANAATRDAAGASRGGGRAAAAAALEGIEAAAHEGHVAALTEEVAGLQAAQRTAAAAAAATLAEERASFLQADGLLQAMQAQLQAEQASRAETAEEARALQAARTALTVEVRARGLEVTRLAQEVGMLQARLGASNQEAISADEIASNLRLQQAHDALACYIP